MESPNGNSFALWSICQSTSLVTLRRRSHHINFLLTIPLLTASRWSTSGSRGVTHISCHDTRIRSGGTGENKTDEQTRTMLGVTKSRRRICNTTCMCGLTLAWVTSENSTSNWNADIFRLNLLRWTLSCLLLSPESTASVRGSTPTLLLTRLSAVPSPTPLSPLSSQLSFASPYHFRSKNPLSGFAPKQTKESSAWATHMVLHPSPF